MNVVSYNELVLSLCTSLLNLKSLDIEMGTVRFAILNINNPIRYFTNVTNGNIPVSLYHFQKRPRNENL